MYHAGRTLQLAVHASLSGSRYRKLCAALTDMHDLGPYGSLTQHVVHVFGDGSGAFRALVSARGEIAGETPSKDPASVGLLRSFCSLRRQAAKTSSAKDRSWRGIKD